LPEEEKKAEQNYLLQMRKNHTKQERLGKRSDIDRVFREGNSVSVYGARLIRAENGLAFNRVVFIPARKYGHAVSRNRIRRHAKEIYRQEKHRFITGLDIVIVFYPGSEYDYSKRKEQMIHLFSKAGIIQA